MASPSIRGHASHKPQIPKYHATVIQKPPDPSQLKHITPANRTYLRIIFTTFIRCLQVLRWTESRISQGSVNSPDAGPPASGRTPPQLAQGKRFLPRVSSVPGLGFRPPTIHVARCMLTFVCMDIPCLAILTSRRQHILWTKPILCCNKLSIVPTDNYCARTSACQYSLVY